MYIKSLVRFIGSLTLLGLFAAPVLAYASVSVSIEALSPSTNLTVGQGVTFNVISSGFVNPTYSVSDSASGGSTISSGDINSSGDFSWTPGNNDIGTHNLTITVNDSQGDTATSQETLTVTAAPSISIGAVSPSTTVISGQNVSFTANITGFTNPSFTVADSFSGSSVTNGSINSSGQFSWTPAGTQQNGTHNITVYVNDSLGHSAQASETITVQSAPSLTIQSLEPGTSVNPGQTVSFSVSASNFSSTPTYSVSDTYGGSVTNSDINSSGNFSWVPGTNDDGTHTITITAYDNSGHTASASETISVGGTPVSGGGTIQGFTSGSSVVVGQPVTFTIVASGFSNPVFSIADSFGGGSSVTNSDINSAGYFSWTPNNSDVGTHTFTIFINDSSGHSASATVSLTVTQANVTIVSISPSTNVTPGTLLDFTVSPQGFTNPSYSVSDGFGGSTVSNSDINSSGQFTWTPTTGDIGSHTITVYTTDSSGHSANTQIVIDVESTAAVTTTATTAGSTLGQLEAQLQQEEAEIAAAGGNAGAPTATATFTEELSAGMSDAQVTALQTALEQQGDFSGSVTGYYGPITTAAVEKFQAAHGLAQVGFVGPATRAALNALTGGGVATTSTSSTTIGDGYVFSAFIGSGDQSNDVTELQKRLTAFGDYSGPVTGYFGSLTQAAVEEFQGQHAIDQVGYVGPSTRAALNQ